MSITNSSGGPITINRFFAYWAETPSQRISQLLLDGALVWNPSDPDSPTDIPLEGDWANGANLTIPNGATSTLVVLFAQDLEPTGYELHVVFDIGCQVSGAQ
jgi:hypothetical protein